MGIEDGAASMFHFRTPPLWGLRDTAPYLHNGSASTIEAAIERHYTEGATSRDAFLSLDEDLSAALLVFLRSI